jgi:hypothetical protein
MRKVKTAAPRPVATKPEPKPTRANTPAPRIHQLAGSHDGLYVTAHHRGAVKR